jgi:hypothetical protein
MNKFNELVAAGGDTADERAFLETHTAIMRAGSIVSEFMVELAVELKKMRDGKLYVAAGFDTFERYAEDAIGLKRSQAYRYIGVVESLGADFVRSSGQIGITKLSLLAGLTDEDRDQIVGKGKVEDVSVRELKEQIKELQEQHAAEIQGFKDDAAAAIAAQEELESELKTARADAADDAAEKYKKQIVKLQGEILTLKQAPKEIKTVPQIAVDTKTLSELSAAQKALAERDGAIAAKEAELAKVRQQLKIVGDENLVRFKIKFDELQGLIKEVTACLETLDEAKREKCRAALRAVAEGLK